jgi:WD40 repeat protein
MLSEQITTIHLSQHTRSTPDPSSNVISLEGNPSVVAACYSPDRTLYAASMLDGRVSLWNTAHDLLWESDTPIHPIHLLRLSADRLVLSSPDGSVCAWGVVQGKPTDQSPITSGPQLNSTNAHWLSRRSSSSQSL